MKKLVMGILFSLLVIQAAGATDSKSAAKVLAKVGDLEITDQDMAARLAQIPPQYKNAYASDEGKKQFLDQLVQEQLVYLQAKKEKYDTDVQVLKQLEQVKRNLMVRQFISNTFSKIKVDEEEIKAYYQDHKAEFTEEPKVWAKHILCKTEEEAKAARDRVLKGEAFEDVAKEVSTGPSGKKGGDLGWFAKGRMVPEFGEKAFSLEKDAVSEPVKTQFGYHIIKVYGKKEAGTKSFEDVKADLQRRQTAQKQKQHMDEMIGKLKKEYPVTIF